MTMCYYPFLMNCLACMKLVEAKVILWYHIRTLFFLLLIHFEIFLFFNLILHNDFIIYSRFQCKVQNYKSTVSSRVWRTPRLCLSFTLTDISKLIDYSHVPSSRTFRIWNVIVIDPLLKKFSIYPSVESYR